MSETRPPVKDGSLRYASLGMSVNSILVVWQMASGLAYGSSALMADSLHTLADLVADIVTAVGIKLSLAPPDSSHPYGHGKFQTMSQLLMAILLCLTGLGFMVMTYERLLQPPQDTGPALWVALATLLAKETLYQVVSRAGKRLNNPLLLASAWHHRSDALSSLGVFMALLGSKWGYGFLDPLSAMVLGGLILSMGVKFAKRSANELLEGSVEQPLVAKLVQEATGLPGVVRVLETKARRIGQQIVVDVHVQVKPQITVSDGHQVALRVRKTLMASHPYISDVMVHIDPEDDEAIPTILMRSGPEVEKEVTAAAMAVEGVQRVSHVALHYLDGTLRTKMEIVVPETLNIKDAAGIAKAVRRNVESVRGVSEADIHLEVDDS
ncbi:MAG: cation diffusion facilitator family transporter [Planctomycetota bacterium]